MTIFIVFNRYNRDSFNKNVADIPDHLGRSAMSATFKVYPRSDHLVVMLFEYIILAQGQYWGPYVRNHPPYAETYYNTTSTQGIIK